MHITLSGTGDAAGVPVHGCRCQLCRQARAVRHLRRRPTSLRIQEGNTQLLVEAGTRELVQQDWLESPDAVLLCSWQPEHWAGLIPLHLGAGTSIPVYGPVTQLTETWLATTAGQLTAHPSLTAGHTALVGRLQIQPFALDTTGQLLAYGIVSGEQRLAYLPSSPLLDGNDLIDLAAWQPQAIIMSCPSTGRPADRVTQIINLHQQLGRPTLLLTGIDHHLDTWLAHYAPPLPPGIRATRDDQRIDVSYLNEYRRLDEAIA